MQCRFDLLLKYTQSEEESQPSSVSSLLPFWASVIKREYMYQRAWLNKVNAIKATSTDASLRNMPSV